MPVYPGALSGTVFLYTWNNEGLLKSAAGVNYTYDGDLKRKIREKIRENPGQAIFRFYRRHSSHHRPLLNQQGSPLVRPGSLWRGESAGFPLRLRGQSFEPQMDTDDHGLFPGRRDPWQSA
jgi:hypothetical protein